MAKDSYQSGKEEKDSYQSVEEEDEYDDSHLTPMDDISEETLAQDYFVIRGTVNLLESDDPKKIKKQLFRKSGMVLFYDPSCTHCQEFMSVWFSFGKRLGNAKFYLLAIDITSHPKLAQVLSIKTVPWIGFLRNGQFDKYNYQGGRSTNELIHAIKHYFKNEIELDN